VGNAGHRPDLAGFGLVSTEPASAPPAAPAVNVDRDVCVGSGYCQRIAPAVFDIDQTGLAVVLATHPSGADADAAREAEASCPSLAITVQAQ
jgi:ferredoxin